MTLITAYSALEAFYLTLVPYNMLMANRTDSEGSKCDPDMAAQKAWVSKCRLVLERDFLRLAAVKIVQARHRENTLWQAHRAKGEELQLGIRCLGCLLPCSWAWHLSR